MFQKITRNQLEQFLAPYATDKKILDVGSGGSSYGRYFPNRLSIDIDPRRMPDIVGDAHNLPFQNESYDFVLCTEVIEHVKNPRQVVGEIARVLKPGGMVVLSTRFLFPIHDAPHDYWRFTEYGMRELFTDWDIIELRPETINFSTMAVLFQRIGFQTTLKANKILKFFIYVRAWILDHMNWLIEKTYGDIGRKTEVSHLMASGYYIAAKKKS
jgi:ubiquinone/menaquinone biosynthesis C-methylase UbiE